jgi:predicted small secreted protein
MNRPLLLIIAAALSATLLPSCSTVSNGGQTVNNPSVSEMEKLEQEWGLPPRQTKPKLRELRPGETPPPASAPAHSGEAPQPLAPAALPQGAAASPPAMIEPAVDAATLQKLR